jgi:ribulose-phosphate 3-epimerase
VCNRPLWINPSEVLDMVKIAAGLSACDFGCVGGQVAEVAAAGVDYIHVDAQDLTSGSISLALMGSPKLIHDIRKRTDLPIEVHANVEGVTQQLVDAWIDAGASLIILPMEHYFGHKLGFLIKRMRDRGCKAGLTVSPAAPLVLVEESIDWADRLVIYTRDVITGRLREGSLRMVDQARRLIDARGLTCELCCDGGLDAETLPRAVAAGADVLEFSRAIFYAPDGIDIAVARIRAALSQASREPVAVPESAQ